MRTAFRSRFVIEDVGISAEANCDRTQNAPERRGRLQRDVQRAVSVTPPMRSYVPVHVCTQVHFGKCRQQTRPRALCPGPPEPLEADHVRRASVPLCTAASTTCVQSLLRFVDARIFHRHSIKPWPTTARSERTARGNSNSWKGRTLALFPVLPSVPGRRFRFGTRPGAGVDGEAKIALRRAASGPL